MTNEQHIDQGIVRDLPVGALVRFTYDELGAGRPATYHTVEGVVRYVTDGTCHTYTVHLDQVRRTRPSGEVTERPSINLTSLKVMAVEVVEGLAM